MTIEHFCICCGRKITTKNSTKYCKKHFHQIQTYGKTLDSISRTKFDPNEFRFVGNDIVEFDTYNSLGEVVATYKIDAEDYPKVSKYKWRTLKGYASYGSKIHYLHRLIMNAPPGQEIGHINQDPTDNRKSNLRIASSTLQKLNRKSTTKDIPVGVKCHSKSGKWYANIRIQYKLYCSPCYKSKEEAAFARYILEQLFLKEYIHQGKNPIYNVLTEEQKQNVIETIRSKYMSTLLK